MHSETDKFTFKDLQYVLENNVIVSVLEQKSMKVPWRAEPQEMGGMAIQGAQDADEVVVCGWEACNVSCAGVSWIRHCQMNQ